MGTQFLTQLEVVLEIGQSAPLAGPVGARESDVFVEFGGDAETLDGTEL